MTDLKSPSAMYIKAALMLAVGLLASTILLLIHPELQVAALLATAVWGFCRAYYFAFYVIEHYVDGAYRFRGLVDFMRYLLRRRE